MLQLFGREFRKAPNETDEIPNGFRLILRTPGRHSSKSNPIADDVIQLAVIQLLGIRLTHVGNLGIEIFADKSVASPVDSMTDAAVLDEVFVSLGDHVGGLLLAWI